MRSCKPSAMFFLASSKLLPRTLIDKLLHRPFQPSSSDQKSQSIGIAAATFSFTTWDVIASASILCETPSRRRSERTGETPKQPQHAADEPNARPPTRIPCHSSAGIHPPRHIPFRVRLRRPRRGPAEVAQCESPSAQPRSLLPAAVLRKARHECRTWSSPLLRVP